MTKDEAAKIISDYEGLVSQALAVVATSPHYARVDNEDHARISFDGGQVVLSWITYESDYYGGGYTRTESTKFPTDVLLMSAAELKSFQAKVKKEELERQLKVRAAEAAVARDRAEAKDRAEWARLRAKFGETV